MRSLIYDFEKRVVIFGLVLRVAWKGEKPLLKDLTNES